MHKGRTEIMSISEELLDNNLSPGEWDCSKEEFTKM
jgi:hypothetical protein